MTPSLVTTLWRWQAVGSMKGARRLHLVDLNGAFDGVPVHKDVVTAIAKAHPMLPIQLGGGVRSLDTIRHYLEAELKLYHWHKSGRKS